MRKLNRHRLLDRSIFSSATGASREIICLALREKVELVISEDVLEETEENLAEKAPETVTAFLEFVEAVPFEVVAPTAEEIQQAASHTADKDAMIVAAARRANVDHLVSLDRQHLVEAPEVAEGSGLSIILPVVNL